MNIEEQIKFVKLLEHRQMPIFALPKNIVTTKEISKGMINEEIYSLIEHI